MNFTKSTAQIGNIFADVFVSDEANDYFYSLTSIAGLIGKNESSARNFSTRKRNLQINPLLGSSNFSYELVC